MSTGSHVASLAPSGSSARLTDMDSSVMLHNKRLTLLQLVQLDSDVRLIVSELPNVWNTAWKQLASLGISNENVFESKCVNQDIKNRKTAKLKYIERNFTN